MCNLHYTAGGLIGYILTDDFLKIENCYNFGSVISDPVYSGGLIGRLGGVTPQSYIVKNCYNINTILFGTYFETNYSEFITVTNTGLINVDGTFPNSTPYPDLLTALNAWVDANKSTYPELKNWVMGDNGYPTLAD